MNDIEFITNYEEPSKLTKWEYGWTWEDAGANRPVPVPPDRDYTWELVSSLLVPQLYLVKIFHFWKRPAKN